MCGIVGAVAQRDVQAILVEGLKRLEYRGYDSAGIAVVNKKKELLRSRALGKVAQLEASLEKNPINGKTGIAHTRWATHGVPAERNAHPHQSSDVALVHNGIIENHAELREKLATDGYEFSSDTDTEVIVHLLHQQLQKSETLLAAVQAIIPQLEGAYGLAAIYEKNAGEMVVARSGSPLVVGAGVGENFIASDVAALLPVTSEFMYLQEGDIAHITADSIRVFNDGEQVEREIKQSDLSVDSVDRGEYRHYMLKEIYEQPVALRQTIAERLLDDQIDLSIFGENGQKLLAEADAVHIVSCGTSYHAALVARYWIEQLANVPCVVEIASEFRYRQPVVAGKPLFVTISQSGETADTMAALQLSKTLGYVGSLSICNVDNSSLVRESDMVLLTKAGPEIGVASTKAFTTQLAVLLILAGASKQIKTGEKSPELINALRASANLIEQTLQLDKDIEELAEQFGDKHHSLFLGRGSQYPVAMEGALKLKEISYIHAEAYAAGELKHGPLALVDENMPIVAVAPNNELLDKLKSNLQEVKARGGQLYVFADDHAGFEDEEGVTVIPVPACDPIIEPIIYTIPLQLLSYHVAVLKGTDVDQPRNLAKSVTVE